MYTGNYTNKLFIAASFSLLSSQQLGPGWSWSLAGNARAGPRGAARCGIWLRFVLGRSRSRVAFLGAAGAAGGFPRVTGGEQTQGR